MVPTQRSALLASGACCHWLGGAAFLLLFFVGTRPSSGAAGGVVTSYTWGATDFVQDPNRSVVYASCYNQNAVAVINTQNLSYQLINIGSNPNALALSPDGSKLYVADSGSSFIGVLDTQTLTTLDPILVPGGAHPQDIVFGNNNRLFVLANGIQQIDATTGATAGPTATGISYYGGTLEITPDRNTLFYGQQGLSPTTMYKINASGNTLSVASSITTGSNGHDVALNHAGTVVAHPNGAPYSIGLMRTSDLATLGTLNTGPYPVELAFSPDDLVAYAYIDTVGIRTYSTSSFLSIGPSINATGNDMFVDASGKYLFATGVGTTVYDTGRLVPEPTSSLAAVALVGVVGLRRRRPDGDSPRTQ